jgi:hypothetical protein
MKVAFIRIPDDLHSELEKKSELAGLSLNAYCLKLLADRKDASKDASIETNMVFKPVVNPLETLEPPFELVHTEIPEITFCELCKREKECRKAFEDGEERLVCLDCVILKLGKRARKVWDRMGR